MKGEIAQFIREAILKLQDNKGISFPLPEITFDRPKRKEHGDLSTNIAMVLAPIFKVTSKRLAEDIKDNIKAPSGFIKRIDIAGPGFINIFIEKDYWYRFLKDVVSQGESYGKSKLGGGRKVQVEFVSANPTGPLHVGHGRGAIVGDCLSEILKAVGYEVTKEYYINDVGNQMELLGLSVYSRYMELLGRGYPFPENGYKGGYITDIAREIQDKEGDRFAEIPMEDVLPYFTEYAANSILGGIKKDLKDFGVNFDLWYSEKSLFEGNRILKTIEELSNKGLIYERDGALWFRSTDFGDDKDRVLKKADGNTTYFASDVAYHREKLERGFDRIIDIWGADHHGYQPRMKAFMKAMGVKEDRLSILLVQFVTLLRGGEKVSMSTRAGEFVTLREVIDEVGKDAARFFFLLRRSDAPLEFDLNLAKRETPENPVFYIQYAYARICSIFAVAKERGIDIPSFEDIDTKLLSLDEEIDLIKAIVMYPEVIESCALNLAPHHIAFYLQELAGIFHSYYNKTRVVSQNPEDMPLTLARLYLCKCLKIVIKNALTILGISPLERM